MSFFKQVLRFLISCIFDVEQDNDKTVATSSSLSRTGSEETKCSADQNVQAGKHTHTQKTHVMCL